MKFRPPEPLSAFAVYKKMYEQKSSESTSKLKKPKTKRNKELNQKKILLGLENNEVPIIKTKLELNSKNENSAKCKSKSIKKDKESPKSTKTERKMRKKRANLSSISDISDIETTENNSSIQSSMENTMEKIKINNPIKDGLKLFEWMIFPMTHKEFFKSYWEKEPLYIGRRNKKYHSHLLSSTNLDNMIRENSLYYTRNIDVVSYQNEEKEVLNPEGWFYFIIIFF